jgi:hypothetical protein
MARGRPDYGITQYETSIANSDVGMLIIAMKGINSLDNKGKVIFFDTFSEGLYAWGIHKIGSGIEPVLSTARVEVSPASVAMEAGSTTVAGRSFLERILNMTGSSKIGLECGIYSEANSPKYDIQVEYDQDGLAYNATITFDPGAKTLSIISGGAYAIIQTFSALPAIDGWLSIKLILNLDLGYYDALVYGRQRIDLSAYPIDSGAIGREDVLKLNITARANSVAVHTGYLGHVILTTDEP